jgi:integrase
VEQFDDFVAWLSARSLRTRGRALAPGTLKTKVEHLQYACTLVNGSSRTALCEALTTRDGVERLLDRLYVTHSPATVRIDVAALKDFGAFAVASGLMERCYVESTDSPRNAENGPITIYSQADVDRLLLFAEVLGNLRFRMLLETVVATGMRISEALNIRWVDLRLDDDPKHFYLTTTKSGRPTLVPLNLRLREVVYTDDNLANLRDVPQNHNATRDVATYLFPMTYNVALAALVRLCDRAGVEPKGWHAFRHTHATRLLQRGVPVHAVSKLLNHSNVGVTQKFYDASISLDFARYLD